MFQQSCLIVLVLAITGVSGLVRPVVRPRICRAPNSNQHTLAMSAKTLQIVKERYSGRADLPSMIDGNDNDCLLTEEMLATANLDMPEPPQLGDSVTGYVVEIDDSGAFIEIGGKMSGFLPLEEASLSPIKHVKEALTVGQTVTAEMIGTLRGVPVVSLRSTQLAGAWEAIQKIRTEDAEMTVRVLEVNRGGAVCSTAEGLRAFLPGSHYMGTPDESIIGMDIKVKVLDVIEEEGKLVVSQRLALAAAAPVLARGSLVTATVTGLRPYGAFLEVEGGYSGLLHISQISASRVDDVSQVFSMGESVKVMIMDHDRTSGRVALSTKVLENTPGAMLTDKASVQANAQENLDRYKERQEAERVIREAAAREIAAGLDLNLGLDLGLNMGTSNASDEAAGSVGDGPAISDGAGAGADTVDAVTTKSAVAKPRGRKPKGAPMSKLSPAETGTGSTAGTAAAAEGKAGTDRAAAEGNKSADKSAVFSVSESIESILASIVADSSSASGGGAK